MDILGNVQRWEPVGAPILLFLFPEQIYKLHTIFMDILNKNTYLAEYTQL
jgi:hypothetical protein